MDSYFIPWVIICTISIYFEAQIVPDWVPLSWLYLLTCPHILVVHLYLYSKMFRFMFILYFLSPTPSNYFSKNPDPFSGEWYLEISDLVLSLLSCTRISQMTLLQALFSSLTSMKLAGLFYYKTHGSLFHFHISSCAAFCLPGRRFYLA